MAMFSKEPVSQLVPLCLNSQEHFEKAVKLAMEEHFPMDEVEVHELDITVQHSLWSGRRAGLPRPGATTTRTSGIGKQASTAHREFA